MVINILSKAFEKILKNQRKMSAADSFASKVEGPQGSVTELHHHCFTANFTKRFRTTVQLMNPLPV